MAAKEHNKLLGIFLMVHGGIQAFGMIIACLVYAGMGTMMFANARRNEEQMIGAIFIGLVVFIIALSVIFIVPQLLGGWKLLKETPSARTWGIIASIVALLGFPLGTAAGIYGLWFLCGEEGKRFYLDGENQQNMFSPPPPPNNWQ